MVDEHRPRVSVGSARRRALLLAAVVFLLVLSPASPTRAETTTTTPDTSSSTTTPGPSTSTAAETTVASTNDQETDATAPGETSTSAPTSNPAGGSDGTKAPPPTSATEGDETQTESTVDGAAADDPLSGEGPGEEAPGVDPDLPPPETYGGQEPYTAPEILWSSVAEAERKLDRSRQARRDAVATVRALRLRQKHLDLEQASLDDRNRRAIDELSTAQDRYRGRAVTDFRLFAAGVEPELEPDDVLRPTDLDEVMQRRRGSRLATAALGVGSEDLGRLHVLRQSLDGEARTLLDRLRVVADYRVEAVGAVASADDDIEQASIEYEAFRAGSEIFITGVVFPIGGPHNLPLIDSFGFPRMTGTQDEHWHEGIDLFAPRGTPLVAAERGLVTRVGSGRLGGLKLWLVGESGTEWYYAHLDSFGADVANGQIVEAGDLLGYVGNTGNAVGTPPHLHLQMHPDGGRPVNPYPLLKTVSDLDQQAIADGTHRGYRYGPAVVNRAPAATTPPDSPTPAD